MHSFPRRATSRPVRGPRIHRWACALLVASCVSFVVAPSAHADETWVPPLGAVRIGGALTGGYATLHRSTSTPSSTGALAVGGELRVHPYSAHGLVLGFTQAEGIFGPRVSIVDAGYSLLLSGSRHLRGVTPAVYLDVGPALGIVSHAGPESNHAVLGGRVSLAVDLIFGGFVVGTVLGYRGGVPLGGQPDRWEGAFTWLARVGFAFDVGEH
ncbi:MAG: hypothetical protein NVSMB47_16340 [Polyangiales bacterium]